MQHVRPNLMVGLAMTCPIKCQWHNDSWSAAVAQPCSTHVIVTQQLLEVLCLWIECELTIYNERQVLWLVHNCPAPSKLGDIQTVGSAWPSLSHVCDILTIEAKFKGWFATKPTIDKLTNIQSERKSGHLTNHRQINKHSTLKLWAVTQVHQNAPHNSMNQ